MTPYARFMLRNVRALGALIALGALVSCGGGEATSDDDQALENAGGGTPGDDSDEVVDQTPGLHLADESAIFRTEAFTVEPGQERFLCYTQTLEEDLVVSGYATPGNPMVHHAVLSKTSGTEPEGMSECDVLFRFEWEPIFSAGAGASDIQFPEGVGQVLPAGTRLLTQLHLLNAGSEPATHFAEIQMQRSPIADPRPMATYAVGNFDVSLPPQQESTVEGVCTVSETVNFVAAFPHMHLLGTALTFEVGPSLDQMTKVYERNPYDFDDQHLELVDLTLNAGDVTRVTCHYDNPTDETITFGESTNNEMCFLVGFAADRETASGCVVGTFPEFSE